MPVSANGLIVAAPRSGSGKTVLTLGLLAALRARGLVVAPAKTGPDYIDAAILSRAAGCDAVNLDPWAMSPARLLALAASQAAASDLLLVEGAMGLFDGAADGTGSTGDLAAALGLPVILVVDAERQSQSIAALVHGFATWRPDVTVAGLIVNRVATTRHEQMLRAALAATGIPLLGVIPRRETLVLPDRHLGLVLPAEVQDFDGVVASAADAIAEYVDLNRLVALSVPLPEATSASKAALPPLGQRIAIARDDAFAFLYPHWLDDWRAAGAELSFFSPLADESPAADADAVFLPGGYPELHAARLSTKQLFMAQLQTLRDRGALIYGECGGYMAMGTALVDATGARHAMAGLLGLVTSFEKRRMHLGYRRAALTAPIPGYPAGALLRGHEFHYSTILDQPDDALAAVTDATDTAVGETGSHRVAAGGGRATGTFFHIIDAAARSPS